MEEGEPIEHKLVTRAISTAQKRVETRNFEIRKHLLEYDDVMNKQREIVYGLRRQCLEDESQEETILEWMGCAGRRRSSSATRRADTHPEDWDLKGLSEALHRQFDFRLPADATSDELLSHDALLELVRTAAEKSYRERETDDRPRAVPPARALDHARAGVGRRRLPGDQPALARAPPQHGPSEGGHRAPRLRAARSAGGVQEGSVRDVPGDDRPPERGGGGAALQGARDAARSRCRRRERRSRWRPRWQEGRGGEAPAAPPRHAKPRRASRGSAVRRWGETIRARADPARSTRSAVS